MDCVCDETMELILRFDDVIEPEKLRQSLGRLLEIGNWRKLGARVRPRENNAGVKFEYHIPEKYTETRPGFIYRESKYSDGISNHPTASRLPRQHSGLSILGATQDFASLGLQPGDPRHLADWAYTDLPQLFFHHTTFKDATVIAMTYPHSLMDGMGHGTFLRAWIAVLHGREDEVPELGGFEDARSHLTEGAPATKYLLHQYILGWYQTIVFGCWRFIETLWSSEEDRVVCIPRQFVQELRANVLDELDSGKGETFVSNNDVLLAWFARTILSIAGPLRNRSLVLMNSFNIRSVALSSQPAFINNAVIPACTILPIWKVLREPMSFLAMQVRRSLVQQRGLDQIHAWYKLMVSSLEQTGRPRVIGTSDGFTMIFSNWDKASLFRLDLSPAASEMGLPLGQRSTQLGYPSCVLCTTPFSMLGVRSGGCCLGKDAEGNWWTQWRLRRTEWDRLETILETINHQRQTHTGKGV
ncbi:hypothetical protein HK57_00373 [Aspergillus ustus]|uniref:O-acyltransferase pboC n=1 Tax=Aspergillus ustus TaxID=40382 RepID=PBOC_ASPUT|nr:RecName: Full=O-acyltransferase pboC; AltName: Full=Protubonine biosynthesis cluster protein C [Aspergillus ustus]KIA75846.1 hypothetical protein HK57_00373 [Aspergillus ustus]